ncbi:hypothetical protein [Nostocoides sp. Soil756]|uniref:hypothetical protein n=1 Tax=Nostocoides sp. Soil756 TaxID=1736399 RepID=UPI0009E68503|nr:hypothetical protein [Tetrasphaera sp. Soil756]
MTPRSSRRKGTPNRSATRGRARPLRAVAAPDPATSSLMGTLRSAIRSDDPTALVTLVSSMLSVTDAWAADEELDAAEAVPLDQLLDSLVGTSYAETTVALHAAAAMLPDDLDAARVRRAIGSRRHPVPPAVTGLRELSVHAAAKLGDELADGDNVILGLEWPGIGGVTAVVYVDEAFGTRVKDVFLVPEPFGVVCERYRELLSESGRTPGELTEIPVADARASIEAAIAAADAAGPSAVPADWTGPDGDPVGWPGARPFVELVLRRMPAGGRSVLTSGQLGPTSTADAIAEFLASPFAAAVEGEAGVAAAVLIAEDAAAGAGHPLRWSPVQVELALTQRLPWADGAGDEALAAVADVLPAFARFAHAQLGAPAEATAETLAAVQEWLPVFTTLRRAPAVARWREIGGLVDAFERGDTGPLLVHSLADEVGGPAALDALDAEPLPSEPPALDTVPPDVRESVAAIAEAIEVWLRESPRVSHLGALREEWRTAAHRLLVGAAVKDPGWLRRRASVRGRACGVLWATGVANRLVGPSGAVLVKDLAADFGVSGPPSAKAEAVVRAWHDGRWVGGDALGDARLLVSTRRAALIRQRDRYRS